MVTSTHGKWLWRSQKEIMKENEGKKRLLYSDCHLHLTNMAGTEKERTGFKDIYRVFFSE